MFSNYAERYVLRSLPAGRYLGVNTQSQVIETLESPADAWIFHTHDGACLLYTSPSPRDS